eukprot:TRINITY_DN17101_c0_g1_i2.p1 TRINITY_DN17101_c0_g1~~TRINITY_DN17101_c0_g1_i2.p1  ORF type:complete len:139 (-),score=15.63 TRINITY_DN17101_c0_g1_i2:38-454(-)
MASSSTLTEAQLISSEESRTNFMGYMPRGFVINDVEVTGSVVATPQYFLMWDAHSVQDITPESLVLLPLLQPRPDVVIIGTGPEYQTVSDDVITFLRKHNIQFELTNTENAIATFNVLNEEGRNVVGAILHMNEPTDQ